MANMQAVQHLFECRFRIDPFLAMPLADDESMQLDRWSHTALSYIL